jgi:hypothetical protein
MTNVFTSDKNAAAHTNQEAAKLKAMNDAENAAAAAKLREDAVLFSGYAPSSKNVYEVELAAHAALVHLQKAAVEQETSNFVPLALAFADYAALRLAATGKSLSESDMKEWFSPIGKAYETSKRTIAGYVTMARKAGMLCAAYNTTTIYPGWWRITADSEFKYTRPGEDKPAGEGWTRDILGDIAAWRPSVKKGKGKETYFTKNAHQVLALGAADINDAYAKFIMLKKMTPDGKVEVAAPEGNVGKGADDKNTAGQTAQVALHDATDEQLLHAFVTMMKDKVRVAELLKSDKTCTDIFNAYLELDAHVTEDGEVLLVKTEDFDHVNPIERKKAA